MALPATQRETRSAKAQSMIGAWSEAPPTVSLTPLTVPAERSSRLELGVDVGRLAPLGLDQLGDPVDQRVRDVVLALVRDDLAQL